MKSFLKNLATGIAVFGIILGWLSFVSVHLQTIPVSPELTAEWCNGLLSVPAITFFWIRPENTVASSR